MSRPPRKGQPKRHRGSSRQRSILVFTEGRRTEVDYLVYWRRAYRQYVTVVVSDFHGVPLALVQEAVRCQKVEARNERRSGGNAFDEIWCVFDIDEHPNVPEAKALAGEHGIRLAISNPCVELWFLLHFVDQRAWVDRGKAQSISKKHLAVRNKSIDQTAFEKLREGHEAARDRAVALDVKHIGDGSAAGSNPSSGVWELIESISSGSS